VVLGGMHAALVARRGGNDQSPIGLR